MDPKNTDEAPSSSSLPPLQEQDAPADPTAPSSSSSLPRAHEQDAPADPTAPSSSSSSLPAADSTLRPTSSSYPVIPTTIDCFVCRRRFNDFAVWFEHMMDDHPRSLEEERENHREILCPWCSRSYLAHDDRCCTHVMNARSEEMGSSERNCHVCGISLENPEEYKKHVWDVHTPIFTICGQVVAQPRRAGAAAADHQPSSSSARSRDQASSSTAPVAPWPPSSSSAVAAWSRDQASSSTAAVAPWPPSSSSAVAARSRYQASSSTAPVAPSTDVEASRAREAAEQAAKEEEFLRYLDSGGFLNDDAFLDLNKTPPSSPADG